MSNETICVESEDGAWELELSRTYDAYANNCNEDNKLCFRKWKRTQGFFEMNEKNIIKLHLLQKELKLDAFAIDYI